MKKIMALLLGLALLVSLNACGNRAADEDEENYEILRIGVFESLSGEAGEHGRMETLGIQLANRLMPTVEVGGKTYAVDLAYSDNTSSVKNAQKAAENLLDYDISIVLGSAGSDLCIAAGDTFEKAGMPAISITSTSPKITENCEVYYRICCDDSFQGTMLGTYAKENFRGKKAYILYRENNEYARGLSEVFAAEYGESNCVTAQFPEGTEDFAEYIQQAKNEKCGLIFAPMYTETAARFIKSAVKEGLDLPILGGDTLDSAMVLKAAKGSGLSICLSTFYQEGADEAFDKAFRKWLRSDPAARAYNSNSDVISAYSAMGYDAYCVALEALKLAGSTEPSAVLEALPKVTYSGVTGEISFDEKGNVRRNSMYFKTCDTDFGKWVYAGEVRDQ